MLAGRQSTLLTALGFAVLLAVLGLLAYQMFDPPTDDRQTVAPAASEGGVIMAPAGPEMPTASDTRSDNIGPDGRPFISAPQLPPEPAPTPERRPEVPRVIDVSDPARTSSQTGLPDSNSTPDHCRQCPLPAPDTPSTTPTPEAFTPSVGLKPTTLPISSQP